ncbi:MAG: sensor histidine kinase [Acidobacteria bacterium]|nr:sensor histidine kinase [Acidobacteriota bacterium]
MVDPGSRTSRVVLLAGFGGLLLLTGFAGLDGLQALEQIRNSNDSVREDFVARTRLLERIRGDVYISGTYVRDYLLEPEAGKAEGHRYSLLETRNDTDAAVASYRNLLHARELRALEGLTRELDAYWKVLEPVFQWTPEQRRSDGYDFLRDEVFPRRMAMLGIADQIGAMNEAQMREGRTRVNEVFAQFRRRLLWVIALTIGLGLLLAAFSVRKILRLERGTAESRAALEQLSARLVAAQEEERRAIARELHDEVGQALSGVRLELANLSKLIRENSSGTAAKADEIKEQVEGAIRVVRNMSLLLRPSMLDDLGLVPALEWQAREVSKHSGLRVQVEAAEVSEELPEEHKTCVYRIVQEALHNCVQHAAAHSVRITVEQVRESLKLAIEDDGKGFLPARQKGMGLLGMQERVKHLGGMFAIESAPSHGTVLKVVLPLV